MRERGRRVDDRARAGFAVRPEAGSGSRATRAQANLLAVAVALVALTAVTVFGVTVADGALAAADREPLDRRAAAVAADRLVAADAPTTVRPNVLNATALEALAPATLEALAPPIVGRPVSVRLGDRVLLSRGRATGATVRRVVLVATPTRWSRTVSLAGGPGSGSGAGAGPDSGSPAVTLPRRADALDLSFDGGESVATVRADGRVVLHDPDGLAGEFTVRLSRYETTTVTFEPVAGESLDGSVRLVSFPDRTEKTELVVTVGA